MIFVQQVGTELPLCFPVSFMLQKMLTWTNNGLLLTTATILATILVLSPFASGKIEA
jgi:hypothetical protein